MFSLPYTMFPLATPGIERQKYSVPALLLPWSTTLVLNLFAGYGSMRAATKELGLSYVEVDERDLMHSTD